MTTIDPERQQQAKQYARISRRLWLVSNSLSAIYALAWLFFGWAINLRDWLAGISPNSWFLVAGFLVIFGGLYAILTLPLDYYSGFVLPHRFDQSNQTLKDWIIDQLKDSRSGHPSACSCSNCFIWPCASPAICGGCGLRAGCWSSACCSRTWRRC